MVVIEPVPSKTEEKNTVNANVVSKPKSEPEITSSSSATTQKSVDDLRAATPVSGYASDGYETASDTELNNDTDDEAEKGDEAAVNSTIATTDNNNDSNSDGKVQEHQHQQQLPEDSSQKHTITDEELTQKALAQANDAKLEGNKLFKDGLYAEALLQYELALQIVPEMPSSVEIRSICFANRAACFFKLGKYEDTIKECTNALKLNSTYVKALLRRGEAHEKLEHYEEAIADMTKILELDPSHDQARRAIVRLKPLADEKREKMKEEMIGKLKEMGNSVLGRFGMSVDNFKAVKDPNTGSYSISFQR